MTSRKSLNVSPYRTILKDANRVERQSISLHVYQVKNQRYDDGQHTDLAYTCPQYRHLYGSTSNTAAL